MSETSTDLPASLPAHRIPLAFRIAAVALLAHDVLQIIAAATLQRRGGAGGWGDLELRMAGWNLLLRAVGFAVYPLLISGAYELLSTSSGPRRRGARLATLAAITATAASFAIEGLQVWSAVAVRSADSAALERLSLCWRIAFDLRQAGWIAFTAGVLWAGWSERPVRRLAWFAVLASLAAHPISPLLERMNHWLAQHGRFSGYTLAADLMTLVALGLALAHRPPPAHPDEPLGDGRWARTTRAVVRQHRALAALFWITSISVTTTLLVYLSERGPEARSGLNQLWAFGLPSLHLVAVAVLIAALCRAAAAPIAVPRRRLYCAAALYAVFAGLRALQLAHRALAFPELAIEPRTWPLLLPALGGAAHVVLASSLGGLAALLGSPPLAARATSTFAVVTITQLAILGVLARLHLTSGLSVGAMVTHTLVTLLLSLGGLRSLIRTSSALAEELSTRVDLPAAVLRR